MRKKNGKVESRILLDSVHIRETKPGVDGSQEESRTIFGTFLIFNNESQVLDDIGDPYTEIIRPQACTQEFLDSQDVKLDLLHDRNTTIARSNKGVGNLRLFAKSTQVDFEADIPKCDIGDRALALVKSGVYTGCSFEFFWGDDFDVIEPAIHQGEVPTVVHNSMERLVAISLAMDPAYQETSVSARELTNDPSGKKESSEVRARKREERKAAARIRMRNRFVNHLINY